eukprot:9496002-Pyramimonas_sp.AAC.2
MLCHSSQDMPEIATLPALTIPCDVKDNLRPHFFATAMNKLQCTPEKGYYSTVRLSISGTREVILVHVGVLADILVSSGMAAPTSVPNMCKCAKQLSADVFAALVATQA